ncbi:DGQHR domain-containing protein [Pararhizobium sp. DWP3-4]|uniref:DGQHR domain-containing protein n=1 Tax=Pararhizobium sp. DWP3-4 TaxID=2804565 RepID=UPI003CF4FA9E
MTDHIDSADRRLVPALRFKQWLSEWDAYDFDAGQHRRKPEEHIYVFSMKAAELRRLCDVYRRKRDGSNVEGIQRIRDESRTSRIQRYVRYGYPYGDLKGPQRTPDKAPLRKPGWLPTAIVVNILTGGDKRRGKTVNSDSLITIQEEAGGQYKLSVPDIQVIDDNQLAPFEVIDGQHRLWAFDDETSDEPVPDDFELPVVAFYGLDIAWQAYLFWSINVSPKKINPSHAFDLYPLLRTQDWLESVGELPVYREARAQELTETLYSHQKSVWNNRINMLGEKGTAAGVSQAAWVRSLLTTFLSTGKGVSRPGLFQSNLTRDEEPLEWTRAQQAAFLITLWNDIADEVATGPRHLWIQHFKKRSDAFGGKASMLNQDMGVRALLAVANDIFYEAAEEWGLEQWYPHLDPNLDLDLQQIDVVIEKLDAAPFRIHLRNLACSLITYDWRSLEAPGIVDGTDDAIRKRSYRGSGGYASLRKDVLEAVAASDVDDVSRIAKDILFSESVRR